MSRKNLIYNFGAIVGGDMSLASIVGLPTTVAQHDLVTYKVNWSGGQATNGNFGIQYSDDGLVWYDLDFGATPQSNSASGNHIFVIDAIGFKFLRPTYTRVNAGATGSLNINVFASNKGA